MTILVTGSAGHLGEALVRLLKDQGRPVRGLDVKASEFTDVVGTIVDPDVCKQAMVGVRAVLHTASLHKPHVETHTRQDFIDVNVTGTLNLLEAAIASKDGNENNDGGSHNYPVFIFTSTTSAFGDALKPTKENPDAVWITENTTPIPKNVYGVTKLAAENLCQLFHRLYKLPCLVLKVSRFFPEDDDSKAVRDYCTSNNAKVNELLYRRADIYDMATAHVCAIEKAREIGFDRFIISGTSPFQPSDRAMLATDPTFVVQSYFPEMEAIYSKCNYRMFATIDRVYRNDHARERLGWSPIHTFSSALQSLEKGEPVGSELSRQVGKKQYHDNPVLLEGEEGPFPTAESSK